MAAASSHAPLAVRGSPLRPAGARAARRGGAPAAPAGEVAQRAEAALADHAAGGLGAGDEQPADAAGFVPDGTVAEGEVRLLDVPVAIHEEQEVVRPGALPVPHHLGVQRADDVPDLRPALLPALSERARVLGAEDRDV